MQSQTSPMLNDSRWEVTMSSREKFILTGNQYVELNKLIKGAIQPRLVQFPDFAINIAHIVSIVCVDKGLPALPPHNKFVELSDEQREKNLSKLQSIREKMGWEKESISY